MGPKITKVGPGTPSGQNVVSHTASKRLKRGGVLRLKIEPKIVLDSGVEKVVHSDAPKLAKWTLGTSKINQIHWRGSEFQLFALFSCDSLLE